ncbi:hypothetical protein [Bradyrhizobium sp. McL0616]|uniref:hypothetical protein n=1 Tax=Bradyrhizobium sp. McL0616 TaxID=3415674 RepID=UPI003CF46320
MLEGIRIGYPNGNNAMPSFASAYSDEEIAAVRNYVIGHFDGKQRTAGAPLPWLARLATEPPTPGDKDETCFDCDVPGAGAPVP